LPPILPTDNWYTSTKHNYSVDGKKFTENFLYYWTNFIKYNDPNYLRPNIKTESWLPFSDDSKTLEKANASAQLTSARYLVFNQNDFIMSNDFSVHQCDLWGYTSNISFRFRLSVFLQIGLFFFQVLNVSQCL